MGVKGRGSAHWDRGDERIPQVDPARATLTSRRPIAHQAPPSRRNRQGRCTDWRVTAPIGHAAVSWVSERGRPRSPGHCAGRSKRPTVPTSRRRRSPGSRSRILLRRTRHRGQTSSATVATRGATEYPQSGHFKDTAVLRDEVAQRTRPSLAAEKSSPVTAISAPWSNQSPLATSKEEHARSAPAALRAAQPDFGP